jgi:hypothetical protein
MPVMDGVEPGEIIMKETGRSPIATVALLPLTLKNLKQALEGGCIPDLKPFNIRDIEVLAEAKNSKLERKTLRRRKFT